MSEKADVSSLMKRPDETTEAWAIRLAVSGQVKHCTHQENGQFDCKEPPVVHIISSVGYCGLCKAHASEYLKEMAIQAGRRKESTENEEKAVE